MHNIKQCCQNNAYFQTKCIFTLKHPKYASCQPLVDETDSRPTPDSRDWLIQCCYVRLLILKHTEQCSDREAQYTIE